MKKKLGWMIFFLMIAFWSMPALMPAQDYWPPPTPPATPSPVPEKKPEPTLRHPPVEIIVSVDRLKFVGGQNIILKADIIFYQQINPFWEELPKVNFSPFKLEKMVLEQRKMFDREKDLSRDLRKATFLLSLPSSNSCGFYTIPSFSLNYSYFSGGKEIKKTVKSRALKAEKVPILVISSADKDVVTIGEINIFRLTVWREDYIRILNNELNNIAENKDSEREGFERWLKSLEVRGQKITDFQKPEFPNFKILSREKASERHDSIVKEVFEYRLAFYELGGKEFRIPPFHIWYLNRSKEEKTQKPQEIKTQSLTVQVNLVVRQKRQALEWLKDPERHPKKNIYYFGYAPVVTGGICFLIFVVSAAMSLLHSHKKSEIKQISESPARIWSSLSNLQKATIINRQLIIQIRNEFSKMIGGIVGIPNGLAKAKTGMEMAEEFRNAGFPENIVKDLESCFRVLDESIQNYEKGQNFSGAWTGINKISATPEISKFLKKKKKFLIF